MPPAPPVMGRLAQGTVIAGRYRVLSFAAEGAQGTVYAVEESVSRERLALRRLGAPAASVPRLVKRLARELRPVRKVVHPHVCQLREVGEHTPDTSAGDGAAPFAFLAFDWLEGETLAAHLRRVGRLTPERTLLLAAQLASALDATHAARVIHGDLKSGHVMLVPTPSGIPRAVVTDLGLKAPGGGEEGTEPEGQGTVDAVAYLSPEQVEGEAPTPASDLYAFGVLLFEMVTGERPFGGETPGVAAVKRLVEPPPSVDARIPGLPPSWERTLRRCLARRPEERFASAALILEALKGQGARHEPPPPERPFSVALAESGAPLPSRGSDEPLRLSRRAWRGTQPASPEAAHLYSDGLLALQHHDAPLALARLERVVALAPEFAPGHSALSVAYRLSFLDDRAREAARRARALSEGLPREEHLLVLARDHEAHADWAAAREAYGQLFGLCPDNVEYGTAWAAARAFTGQGREALDTLAGLSRLPEPGGGDARIDLTASLVTMLGGDVTASRRHAEWAVARAERAGQPLLVASALVAWAYAQRQLGESARALPALEDAARLCLGRGERGGAARALAACALVRIDLGRLRDAQGCLEAMARLARELAHPSLEAEAQGNAGWVAFQRGELTRALARTRRTTDLYRRLDMRAEEAAFNVQLGMVLRERGDLDEAQRLLEQSRQSLNIVFGDESSEGWASYELGLLLLDRGELVTARGWLERTLELRRARGQQALVAETERALARVALAAGRTEEALGLAERVCAAYAEQRQPMQEGGAQAVRARVLLAGRAPERAREALARARELTHANEYALVAAQVELTRARVALRLGTAEERRTAAAALHAPLELAARGHLMGLLLEARLLRAALTRESAEAAALAELKKVEVEAQRLGYRPLATEAGAALRAGSAR
ncbi:serine/threonine protein kinase [Archangium primigenium]|nr:serine/threonine protein kinase [Archangium primigenium]